MGKKVFWGSKKTHEKGGLGEKLKKRASPTF